MKNLVFLMMALLLINLSYAGEMGEDQKGECVDNPQTSRFQESLSEGSSSEEVESENKGASER